MQNTLIRTARPRFWMYIFGPFVIGLAATPLSSWTASAVIPLAIFALYFTFPANLWIYGVNDIYDYESDRINSKKEGFERLLPVQEHRKTWRAMLLWNVPFWLFALVATPPLAWVALAGFIFFGTIYSAPPIRAKTKPFLDSFTNILYIFPGLFAAAVLGAAGVSWPAVIAGTAWCMAMHAYSAIPDITADTKATMNTVATVLGIKGTLWFCGILWAIAGIAASSVLGKTPVLWFDAGAATFYASIYVMIVLFSFFAIRNTDQHHGEQAVFRLYTKLPLINALIGMALFFQVAGLYLVR
jgi:lycopene elongase/hydratase (dihydrobisanhydrobacterioruberin-forming)